MTVQVSKQNLAVALGPEGATVTKQNYGVVLGPEGLAVTKVNTYVILAPLLIRRKQTMNIN
jgi:hypothetical protein